MHVTREHGLMKASSWTLLQKKLHALGDGTNKDIRNSRDNHKESQGQRQRRHHHSGNDDCDDASHTHTRFATSIT